MTDPNPIIEERGGVRFRIVPTFAGPVIRPAAGCWCGAGCKPSRDWKLTDAAIRSERDSVAEQIAHYGGLLTATDDLDERGRVVVVVEPYTLADFDAAGGKVPAVPEARKPSGKGPGLTGEEAARVAEASAFFGAEVDRLRGGATNVHPFVKDLAASMARPRFRITPRMAEVLLGIRDRAAARAAEREATVSTSQPRIAEVRDWLDTNAGSNDFAASLRSGLSRYGSLTQNQYDAVIRSLDAIAARGDRSGPPADAVSPSPASPEGWYLVAGVVYKVQQARESKNLYAKRLVIEGGAGRWEYAPGMIRNLTEADRMPVEEAAKMGRLYGICMVCGARLTDEKSIAAGIGPVCATRL